MSSLALCTAVALGVVVSAQERTSTLWPPRDIGAPESFGTRWAPALDGERLVVRHVCEPLENPFLRVYLREGLNWIEEQRLTIAPRTPFEPEKRWFGVATDVDGERVVGGNPGEPGTSGAVHVFQRQSDHHWDELAIPAVDPTREANFGTLVSLGGDWLAIGTAVGSADAVHLFHLEGGGWARRQTILDTHVSFLELDAHLVLVSTRLLRLYELAGDAWSLTLELAIPTSQVVHADLDGDRLAVRANFTLSQSQLRIYERGQSGWIESASLPSRSNAVALSGKFAFTGDAQVDVFEQTSTGWEPRGHLPFQPRLSGWGPLMRAAGPVMVIPSLFYPVTDNLRGCLQTYALDGARPTLSASALQMLMEVGGTLTLELDAGVEHAGSAFFLGGSLSGTSPGYRVLGVRIPLVRTGDPYHPVSLRSGRLDGLGRARIEVVLPPIPRDDPLAFLKDRTLHHAFVVWERGIVHVSNVTATTIVGRFPD